MCGDAAARVAVRVGTSVPVEPTASAHPARLARPPKEGPCRTSAFEVKPLPQLQCPRAIMHARVVLTQAGIRNPECEQGSYAH